MAGDVSLAGFTSWLATTPELQDCAEARLSFLDTISGMVSGAGTEIVRKVRATNVPVTVRYVTAARAQDFDDSELVSSTHPSAVLFGALFGLDQIKPLTVGETLDAYCAGFTTLRHFGAALGYGHYSQGWHATATLGVIGAAAACGRALGLTPGQLEAALSLASSRSAGLKDQFGFDASVIQTALAAQSGLQAALLAKSGVAASGTLWGNYLGLYGDQNSPGFPEIPETLNIDPGSITRKPWPCCQYAHRAIHAALSLEVDAEDATNVEISGPEPFLKNVTLRDPNTPQQAMFSLTHIIAAALLDGEISLATFGSATLSRTDIHDLATRITINANPVDHKIDDLSPLYPDTVLVTLKSGKVTTATCANVPGGNQDPLTQAQLIEKFNACCAFAGQTQLNPLTFLEADCNTPLTTLHSHLPQRLTQPDQTTGA